MSVEILITQQCLQNNVALATCYTTHWLQNEPDPIGFLRHNGARFRGIAGGDVSAQMMDLMPNLEIIGNFGVGYDSVDIDAARQRKIRVINTPNVLNDAVAELTLGLMITLTRGILTNDRAVRQGAWLLGDDLKDHELARKTVGIYGLGRIGKEIALRCEAMKMNVIYHGRHQQADVAYPYYDNLVALAKASDWLVVIAPGGADTLHTVNRDVLKALGPKGYLVSMARGSLIDEPAMVEMLQTGKLGGAALDVFEHEPHVPPALFELPNVVLSSHRGSATHETRAAMEQMVVDNLDAHFAGRPLLSPVV